MKRLARLHIALVLARAIYADRDAHRADLVALRSGQLSSGEKRKVLYRMARRAGATTRDVWVPPALLWALSRSVRR